MARETPMHSQLNIERLIVLVSAVLLTAWGAEQGWGQEPKATVSACPHCGWQHPVTRLAVRVRTVAELEQAVAAAPPSTTILVQDGTYQLNRMLHFDMPEVVLRAESGDRGKVILRGEGMLERKVGVAVSIGANQVVIADLTISNVGFHGVQVRGESSVAGAVLHNVRVMDTGQQLLKGSKGDRAKYSEGGLVACSAFEYTDHAPSNYTNGVDILGGRNWIVRDSYFRNIRGPRNENYAAGPTILFWQDCRDSLVTRNVLIDCFRGIALGLQPGEGQSITRESGLDHQGGMVCNNVVCNLNSWADEALEANAARDARIEHNTVLAEGQLPWSISVRFSGSSAVVRNNLTNKGVVERNAGRMRSTSNVTDAARDWFVNPAAGNLRLASAAAKAKGAGAILPVSEAHPELAADAARVPRPAGVRPDAGAFQFSPADKKQ
jgi:hypothetical protein